MTSSKKPTRAEAKAKTRAKIEQEALALFREVGFENTTMRKVAERAGVSLGLAYHYFENKEAIAMAFFQQRVDEHRELSQSLLENEPSLRKRIELALTSSIDVRREDHDLNVVLVKTVIDPRTPVSLFADETRGLHERSLAVFFEVLKPLSLPPDKETVFAKALWALHLLVLLRSIHDASEGQKQTRALIRDASSLIDSLIPMLMTPMFTPLMRQIELLFENTGLALTARSDRRDP